VKLITLALALAALGAQGSTPARSYVTVQCAPPKGMNLSAEKDSTPEKAGEMLLDPASGGYVSHPASTRRFSYIINQDGSGAETMFLDDGRLGVGKPDPVSDVAAGVLQGLEPKWRRYPFKGNRLDPSIDL
jgi:hypothetical protein